jgi:hypothetical protein
MPKGLANKHVKGEYIYIIFIFIIFIIKFYREEKQFPLSSNGKWSKVREVKKGGERCPKDLPTWELMSSIIQEYDT